MQRDRTFESYQDLDLAYEARPSYWVEPQEPWGDGRVELIELSTEDETNDNIVASWTPAVSPEPHKAFAYAYRITACLDLARLSPNGRAINTFRAPPRALGSSEAVVVNARRFLVDFAGGDMAYYVPDPSQVEVVATATNGQILRTSLLANSHIDGLRAMFDVSVKSGRNRRSAPVCARGDADAHGDMDLSLDLAVRRGAGVIVLSVFDRTGYRFAVRKRVNTNV